MLDSATLVPDSALLVPGAAGATEVLADARAAAVDAVRALVASGPARVVVVASSDADRMRPGPFAPTLAGAGLDDAALGWTAPGVDPGTHPGVTPTAVDAPAAAVALLLLAHAGWSGPVTLVEAAPPGDDAITRADGRAAELAALGAGVTAGPERVAVLVAGSLSARRGPDAALAEDPRAVAVDGGMLADLADAGPEARRRLATMAPDLARELTVTAWAPWQVAMGGVGPRTAVTAAVTHTGSPFGVTLAVVTWSTR
ncbi:hypothetical protein [Cellulomonas sp. ATA003]|uniref:hypothetical protein n=1 Tax=Cellulomonas sp. ATA003 TaxID=3073064 RepID=UPI00287301FD|nr:hypothetical protein [Cellulomonas sp. ATA003]WNB84875.1 hypothetical protein REH70_14255 [Cellulomonas sp. ATA003]